MSTKQLQTFAKSTTQEYKIWVQVSIALHLLVYFAYIICF